MSTSLSVGTPATAQDPPCISMERLRSCFSGLDTEYPTAHGIRQRRVYLDSCATGLSLKPAFSAVQRLLPHYSNTHSDAHFSARLSTDVFEWAADRVLRFLGAPKEEYVASFIGSGATAAINKFSERMARAAPDQDQVLVSMMEHHSNDLPHRRFAQVTHLPLTGRDPDCGGVSLAHLVEVLEAKRGRVRYIAMSGASNVTGIRNPIEQVAELAGRYGVPLLVDGAQLTGHNPVQLCVPGQYRVDAYAFSGHKLYAPMSPGVLVARKALMERAPPAEVGGGAVATVSVSGYELAHSALEREHAGTPNVVGAVLLAAALDFLDRVGMSRIEAHGERLVRHTWHALSRIPGVQLYGSGDLDSVRRVPVIAFNIAAMPHALTAAILNDYFGIAVRNACFCAQPYVRTLLRRELWNLESPELGEQEERALVDAHRGMVRASFGCYTVEDDVDRLVDAVRVVVSRSDWYRDQYRQESSGRYHHKSFAPESRNLFDISAVLEGLWRSALRDDVI